MNIAKFATGDSQEHSLGIVDADRITPLVDSSSHDSLQSILNANDAIKTVTAMQTLPSRPLQSVSLLPPIDHQEVWAAGVTYKKSQTARMEESEASASCYDKVYDADRPELFFKALPYRVRGHHQPLRIRSDSKWNVPEPEITLAINSRMRIVGLTIGNDMSSRDIEGENPLYLPQAKSYDASAGVGPWITLIDELPAKEMLSVEMNIYRQGRVVYEGNTSAMEMHREFNDLVSWLAREMTFPDGVFLMTGTGIVPTSDFTLATADEVHITIGGIGTLVNSIVTK